MWLVLTVSLALNLSLFSILAYLKRDHFIRLFEPAKSSAPAVKTEPKAPSQEELLTFNKEPYVAATRVVGPDDAPKKRVLFVGNSITVHPELAGVWGHVSGMAASNEAHDYVQVLLGKHTIQVKGDQPAVLASGRQELRDYRGSCADGELSS